MKKIVSLLMATALSLSVFAGCGKAKTSDAGKAYVDGTYKATYDYIDGHGWKPQIEIVIKDKKISKVTFDYVNPEGKLKTQDEGYNTTMKKISGTSPKEYSPKLGEALVEKQDVDKVDTVTGATHSTENFKNLAKAALAKAEKGDKTEAVLSMDDTYTAKEEKPDQYGWTAQVSITYKDGKITKVEYEELNKDNQKKTEDKKYNDDMKAKSGISLVEAAEKLSKDYMEKGTVDTVAGATGTTAKFKALVEQAKAMRK